MQGHRGDASLQDRRSVPAHRDGCVSRPGNECRTRSQVARSFPGSRRLPSGNYHTNKSLPQPDTTPATDRIPCRTAEEYRRSIIRTAAAATKKICRTRLLPGEATRSKLPIRQLRTPYCEKRPTTARYRIDNHPSASRKFAPRKQPHDDKRTSTARSAV